MTTFVYKVGCDFGPFFTLTAHWVVYDPQYAEMSVHFVNDPLIYQ